MKKQSDPIWATARVRARSLACGKRAGFTLRELLMVLAILVVFASLLLPALARDRSWTSRTFCLHRLAQLQRAMTFYAGEANDWLPPNPDDGNTQPYYAWIGGQAGVGGGNEFDPDVLKDPSRSLLVSYLGGDTTLFRCPADNRLNGLANGYASLDAAYKGHRIPAVRTVSLNGAVGVNPYRSAGKYPVDGPWLDGQHNHTANKTWYCYGKISDFARPGPANTFTFIEENPLSLNDGAFSFVGPSTPQKYQLIDFPLAYHDGAAGVAFADGHVEMHRWRDSRTAQGGNNATQASNADIVWLATHASALIVR